jgi:hypothetical protein
MLRHCKRKKLIISEFYMCAFVYNSGSNLWIGIDVAADHQLRNGSVGYKFYDFGHH